MSTEAGIDGTVKQDRPHVVVNDPQRVRGEALRRSLRYVMLSPLSWGVWGATTGGAAAVMLAKHLGANDLIFSVLGAAGLIGVLFQIPGALITDAIGRRKTFFLWTVAIHRLMYIVVGMLPFFYPKRPGGRTGAVLMAGIILVSMALGHLGGQGWFSWMADLVPARVRGVFFARRSRLAIAAMGFVALLLAVVLDTSNQPWFRELVNPVASKFGVSDGLVFVIAIVFMVAGVCGALDVLMHLRVDEPPQKAVTSDALLNRLAKPLLDREFRRFVIYWSVWNFAVGFAGWVFWVYFLDFLTGENKRAGHAWWANYTYLTATVVLWFAAQCGSILSCPIWGRAVDRFGRKPVIAISSAINATCWIPWLFLGPAMLPWLVLTQFINGFMASGQDVASFNMVLMFNRRGGTAYQSVGAVIFGLAGATGAVIAGMLANSLKAFSHTVVAGPFEHTFDRYAVIIAIGVLLRYGADIVLLPRVIDAGEQPVPHALRFVFENAYGMVNTRIFAPVRTGLELTGRGLTTVHETLTDTITDAGSEIRRWWR